MIIEDIIIDNNKLNRCYKALSKLDNPLSWETFKAVADNPGKTCTEYSKSSGIQHSNIFVVLYDLQKAGLINTERIGNDRVYYVNIDVADRVFAAINNFCKA